jgi:hypothetical protein
MIANLMDMLFGCWHTNYSFPITTKSGSARHYGAQATGTYVVCLECGKEFAYDWKTMKVLGSKPAEPVVDTLAPALVEAPAPIARKLAA